MGRSRRGNRAYFTPAGPRRLEGTRVRYSGYETRRYTSERARYWRGAQISHTSRKVIEVGKKFQYFYRSPRGPASTGGLWRVDVDLDKPLDGGGADPGPYGGLGNCPDIGYRFDVTVSANGNPPSTLSNQGRGTFLGGGVWLASSGGSSLPGPLGAVILRTQSSGGFTTIRAYVPFRDGEVLFGSAVEEDPTSPTLEIISFFPIRVDGNPDDCPNPDPGPGPGGGEPGQGGRYTCTCPDYSEEEQPYFNVLWPSQAQARSWVGSGAGTRRFCKHIYAAAFHLQDTELINETPPGILPPGADPEFKKWLKWNADLAAAQQARERAYDRESLGLARQIGTAARDRYYRNLAQQSRDVLDRYTEIGLLSLQVPGYSSSGFANRQLDAYAYRGLTAAGYDRNFNPLAPGATAWPTRSEVADPVMLTDPGFGGDDYDSFNPPQTGSPFPIGTPPPPTFASLGTYLHSGLRGRQDQFRYDRRHAPRPGFLSGLRRGLHRGP